MADVKAEPRARKPSAYSEQKIARILAAARSLFTRSGYEVTSMDSVSAAAGVSKATVYAHFGSKPELFAAVIANEGQTHMASVAAAASERAGRRPAPLRTRRVRPAAGADQHGHVSA